MQHAAMQQQQQQDCRHCWPQP